MEMQIKKVNSKKRRPAIIAGIIVIAISIIGGGAYYATFTNRILPNVSVNGVSLGGLTKEEARAKLNAAVTIYENTGLNFTNGKKTVRIDPVTVSPDDRDMNFRLVSFDPDAAVEKAFAAGHTGNINTLINMGSALIKKTAIPLPYTLDQSRFTTALKEVWSAEEKTVQDARIVISMNGNNFIRAKTTPDEPGYEFAFNTAVSDLKEKIAILDTSAVTLKPAKTIPAINNVQAEETIKLIPTALALAPLTMQADEKKWVLTASDLAPMLEAYLKQDAVPFLRINKDAAMAYFENLAASYNITPADTRFEIDPDTKKMTVFSPGRNGRKINIDKSVELLSLALTKQLNNEDGRADFNLVAETAKSQVLTQSASDLGIEEVIGIGRSDFSHSSNNRIKNIKHGSSKLNGVLIAPDQEFSAITVLNPITIEDGYFSEQIILGDKITPAVGGGLCQIGTTLFRGAMNSGLDITERQNHSLVVHYYSDPINGNPGSDATLYGPHPDFRFINNTGHWILLTTEVDTKNNALTYTFWGTPDGRSGSYAPPKVLNWIAAPTEAQITETTDLEPDEEKCQNAFIGANTVLTYTIVNPDGAITEEKFNSHYRALPKICMKGIPGPPDDETVMPNVPADPLTENNNINN